MQTQRRFVENSKIKNTYNFCYLNFHFNMYTMEYWLTFSCIFLLELGIIQESINPFSIRGSYIYISRTWNSSPVLLNYYMSVLVITYAFSKWYSLHLVILFAQPRLSILIASLFYSLFVLLVRNADGAEFSR